VKEVWNIFGMTESGIVWLRLDNLEERYSGMAVYFPVRSTCEELAKCNKYSSECMFANMHHILSLSFFSVGSSGSWKIKQPCKTTCSCLFRAQEPCRHRLWRLFKRCVDCFSYVLLRAGLQFLM
jgi:hypothetical protein